MIPTTVSACITSLISNAETTQAKRVLKYIWYATDLVELVSRVNDTSSKSFSILMSRARNTETAEELIEACEAIKQAIRNA